MVSEAAIEELRERVNALTGVLNLRRSMVPDAPAGGGPGVVDLRQIRSVEHLVQIDLRGVVAPGDVDGLVKQYESGRVPAVMLPDVATLLDPKAPNLPKRPKPTLSAGGDFEFDPFGPADDEPGTERPADDSEEAEEPEEPETPDIDAAEDATALQEAPQADLPTEPAQQEPDSEPEGPQEAAQGDSGLQEQVTSLIEQVARLEEWAGQLVAMERVSNADLPEVGDAGATDPTEPGSSGREVLAAPPAEGLPLALKYKPTLLQGENEPAYCVQSGAWAGANVLTIKPCDNIAGDNPQTTTLTAYLTLPTDADGPVSFEGGNGDVFMYVPLTTTTALIVSGAVRDLPTAGADTLVLGKASAGDYDVEWTQERLLPTGGADTLVLGKASAGAYDVEWTEARLVPSGGAQYFVLQKDSAANYDAGWSEVRLTPDP